MKTFIGIPDPKRCNDPGGHCYWAGATPNVYQVIPSDPLGWVLSDLFRGK